MSYAHVINNYATATDFSSYWTVKKCSKSFHWYLCL